ncbi:helix-turn-helix domain-containing protein [Streptomyces sp. NPDC007148]|uniref:helix-turn-helix domain-containing protein n=1 Tax=Streptomyces sp. NPDC007148 TaxID=3364775 RepID=UPI003682FF89
MSPPTTDPQRLQRRRIQAGLNRKELAAKVGCHKSYVGRIERGLGNPSPRLLKQFAEALDCEIVDLMPPDPGATSTADTQAGAA